MSDFADFKPTNNMPGHPRVIIAPGASEARSVCVMHLITEETQEHLRQKVAKGDLPPGAKPRDIDTVKELIDRRLPIKVHGPFETVGEALLWERATRDPSAPTDEHDDCDLFIVPIGDPYGHSALLSRLVYALSLEDGGQRMLPSDEEKQEIVGRGQKREAEMMSKLEAMLGQALGPDFTIAVGDSPEDVFTKALAKAKPDPKEPIN